MAKLKSGHVVTQVTGKDDEDQRRDFKAYIDGTIKLQPGGWYFPKLFEKFANKFFEFEFKQSDVVVMTYPKCGTTWMQEIVWTMKNNPDLVNPLAAMPVNIRCPFIEFDFILLNPYIKVENPEKDPILQMFKGKYPDEDPSEGMILHMAKTLPEPRTMKTHLPFSLLEKSFVDKSKIIYVVRNPKDVCVSYFHHHRLFKAHDFAGTFDQFFDYFLSDALMFGPFWKHLEEAWAMKSHKNVHFIFYEDVKADPKKEIQRLNEFMGTELSDQQINNVVQHTSFAAMKERDGLIPKQEKKDGDDDPMFNVEVMKKEGGFFRKGEAGSWQSKFSKDQEERMNQWIKDNTKNMDIEFKYK